jgi:hypothetical protein
MPVFEPSLDHHDVAGLEEQLVANPIHDDAAPAQTEEELTVVVGMPVGPGSLLEGHPIQPDRLTVIAAE